MHNPLTPDRAQERNVLHSNLLTDLGSFGSASSYFASKAERTSDEQKTIDVFKKTQAAVPFIKTLTFVADRYDFWGRGHLTEGAGSGIVVDGAKGIIVTNQHVVNNARELEVHLADGKVYRADHIAYVKGSDIAILKIQNPPRGLPSIPLGDSSQLEVGQNVLAIGAPFGLPRTLTRGIISSLERHPDRSRVGLFIQTDTAINPGNSGGPLLDTEGRLIGMNTMIVSPSGASSGVGFAIPVDEIKVALEKLKRAHLA